MTPAVKEMALTPRADALAPSTTVPEIDLAVMFQQLAAKPEIPVDKLEVLMNMQRSILADRAKVAFNTAMAAAQKQMRAVAPDAYNKQTQSRYATYSALDAKLRPIYTDHGFALSFNTETCPTPDAVRVVCDVSHIGGHEKPYRIDMPSDGKGAKGGDVMTKTHATGAATQYGMRYLLKMIFNVAIGEDDRDGNAPDDELPPAPKGFDDWLDDLISTADNGFSALEAAWKKSRSDYRVYVTKHYADKLAKLKEKAKAVPA